MTRYHLLAAFLAAQPADVTEVRLTMREVEAIAGVFLPRSSLTTRWWSNTQGHAHAAAWGAAGWRTTRVTTRDRFPMVTFERVAAV